MIGFLKKHWSDLIIFLSHLKLEEHLTCLDGKESFQILFLKVTWMGRHLFQWARINIMYQFDTESHKHTSEEIISRNKENELDST